MPQEIQRLIDLDKILSRKSCFLLGPRQTGKSWLIKQRYAQNRIYNLLDINTFRSLSLNPGLIREETLSSKELVIIDEIQKLPELLNEVHLLIEEKGLKFLLTGSSARKLKREGTNLLGGRASWLELFPFTRKELGSNFDLLRGLQRGFLPSIYFSDNYKADLKDYIEIYLREEIALETSIRNLPAYSRFLDVAAQCSARVVNYQDVASDAQISPSTIREYFHVLKDTLLIDRLPAWRESRKRKAAAKDKYYFFDIGVARYLQQKTELLEGTEDFGDALETYIFHELRAYCSYVSGDKLSYWSTMGEAEVDFLIGDHSAVEVKATRVASQKHLKGLKSLKQEQVFKNYILVSLDQRQRTVDGIQIIPLETFLTMLWSGEFAR